jgi:flavin-dependent dehydrogenase
VTRSKQLKIAIAGVGVVGAYLYRLLNREGFQVDLFDRDPGSRCGLSPCAWGTSRGFPELVTASGLDPEKYVMKHFGYVVMDEYRIEADLATVNKPRLVKDLRQGANIKDSLPKVTEYDRIIDATGVSRAFLPAIQDDIVLPCVQWRIRTDIQLENRIKLGGIGFAWSFPLSRNEYHIGCGSFVSDPNKIIKELGWVQSVTSKGKGKIICACTGHVRLTGPQSSQPFVVEDGTCGIWGVGEAIGCVAPLAGDGIITGMRSAQLLLDYWNDPEGYTRAILREFQWMKPERNVIDKLRMCKSLKINDAWVLRRNSRRMGMKVGLTEARVLLGHLG